MKPNTIYDVLNHLVIEEPSTLPTGCWRWPLYLRNGYGRVGMGGRLYSVHRLIYEHFCGPVPAGFDLDHLCRNRYCANFEHLEPVTRSVNCLRAPAGEYGKKERRKTHCPHGHPYSGDNLVLRKNGKRGCRECDKVQNAKTEARRRAERETRPPTPPRDRCRRGHPYEPDNLYLRPNGARECKICIQLARDRATAKAEAKSERLSPDMDESKN